jgi:hypothetical protein
MSLNTEASAALVFLILYTVLFALLLFGYLTGCLRIRSRYTIILFHVTIRLASQASGLAFGVVGYSNISLLIAYFVLGGKLCLVPQCYNYLTMPSYKQPKGTLRLFCAPTVSLSRGSITIFPRMIHGSNHDFRKGLHCPSDFYLRSPLSVLAAIPCLLYTFYCPPRILLL